MEWMTLEDAAKAYRVTERTIQRWRNRYGVEARLTDGRVKYLREDLDEADYQSRTIKGGGPKTLSPRCDKLAP